MLTLTEFIPAVQNIENMLKIVYFQNRKCFIFYFIYVGIVGKCIPFQRNLKIQLRSLEYMVVPRVNAGVSLWTAFEILCIKKDFVFTIFF